MSFLTIKAAAISLKPKKWDKEHNADKMETFFRAAAKETKG
jgi:predicted amidohydrolase